MAESVGQVIELWRYPVKSMLGEQLDAVEVNRGGLAGARAYAVIDPAENRVGSAKIPRKWAGLYGFRAAYPDSAAGAPQISFPDGRTVRGADPERDAVLR